MAPGLLPVEIRQKLPSRRTVTIGSAPDNDIVIDHPTVSRHHAIIVRRCILRSRNLRDLNSTNGTVVNGRRINAPIAFRLDDDIRIGAVSLSFYEDSSYRSRWLALLGSILFCLFVVGFAATEYLLNQLVEPSTRPTAGLTASVKKAVVEKPPKLSRESRSTAANEIRRAEGRSVAASPTASRVSVVSALGDSSVPEWLQRLNYYRREAKVAAVPENRSLSEAIISHSRYLVLNYSSDFQVGRNPGGIAMHSEDASKQWYSRAGLVAAKQSDLWEGCGPLPTQSSAIDAWIGGPFHRVSLLSPRVRAAAYGSYHQPGGCWAVGLQLEPRSSDTKLPVEFPSDGSEVPFRTTSDEWPNLLPSCTGYVFPAGLAITIQFGYGATPMVKQSSITRNGQVVEHCLVEASNYDNPDPEARAWGRNVLKGFGVVVLVPRQPLSAGSEYAVHIVADGHSYDWRFSTN